MKIKGNMKKATAFTPGLFPAPTAENIAKYMGGASSAPAGGKTQPAPSGTPAPSGPGLKTDKVFQLMSAYMEKGDGKENVQKLQAIYVIEILPKKGDPPARTWVLDLKNGNGKVYQGTAQADATFTFTDDDFEQVCLGKLNAQQAFMTVRKLLKNGEFLGKNEDQGKYEEGNRFHPWIVPRSNPRKHRQIHGWCQSKTLRIICRGGLFDYIICFMNQKHI
jgi:hypothetical protein